MKKQIIYLILLSILLISPIFSRGLQSFGHEDGNDQNQDENNQEENNQGVIDQEENNQGVNDQGENNQGVNDQGENNQGVIDQGENNQGVNDQGENNQGVNDQEQNQEEGFNQDENQGMGFNQDENQGEGFNQDQYSNQFFFEDMKSGVPDFINNMMNQSNSFSELNSEQQMDLLNKEKNTFGSMTENFKNNQNQENRKQVMEKATEIAEYLTKKDCSNSSNITSSEIYEDSKFKECREEKKEIMTDIISLVKDYVKCENIDNLISSGVSTDKQENFKYILFLIYEVSSNPDSLKEGESEILYNVTLCLQENFDTYWTSVETDITSDSDKVDLKQDISLILIKTLSNLVNIQRYDEMDGFIETNIAESGIMQNEQAKKIHRGMLEFAQQFNDFGNASYSISSSMNISVLKFDDLDNNELLNTEQVYNLSDQGIIIKFKPRKMMSDNDGNTMQFISYDSPLVSTNNTNEDNNIVRDFVSLAIFDDEGKQIDITDLSEDAKPEIYYSQNQNRSMKMCFFYNETNGDLDTNGMTGEEVTIDGENYLKCSSEHLTSFTASYRSRASKTSGSDTTSESATQSKSSANTISLMKWLCLVYILLI